MRYARAFGRFWYEFLIGDDWAIAAGVLAALGLTALVADSGVAAWWVMPLAVIVLLAGSLRRGLRASSSEHDAARDPAGEPGESN
jgi:fatty acid desaturase